MSIMASARKLHLYERNIRWLGAPLTLREKLLYYGSAVSSILRVFLTGRKKIGYLGHTLQYDNIVTPLSLQAYPYEINNCILSNIRGVRIKNVLDVGGNIGQFSLTLSHALRDRVLIDVLEPNPEIFELLKNNVLGKNNIRIFNSGVGKSSIKHMYYTPGKSSTGSVFKSNTSNQNAAKKTSVSMVDDISALTGRAVYDLVKVDVEGYEYGLLKAIKPFGVKFMFIEVSLNRYKDFSHSSLFGLIEAKFGNFDIVHLSGGDIKSNNFDVLLRFV